MRTLRTTRLHRHGITPQILLFLHILFLSFLPVRAQTKQEQHYLHYEKTIKPIIEHFCFDCHGDGSNEGGLDLDQFTTFQSMTHNRETWKNIKDHIDLELMPPLDEEQPEAEERKLISKWIEETIFYTDPNNPDPGKVVIRRLNRNEYQNTIKDLLGVTINASSILPLDDTGYGFDTISDVHTVSTAHIEKYLKAAELALSKATVLGPMPWKETSIQPSNLLHHPAHRKDGKLYSNGYGKLTKNTLKKLTPGIYQLQVEASSTAAGKEHAKLVIKDGSKVIGNFDIPAGNTHRVCLVNATINKNSNITFNFTNDLHLPSEKDPNKRDRNLFLHEVKIVGPIDQPRPDKPASHYAIFPQRTVAQTPEQYALEIWLNFARKAFRRNVTLTEIKPYKHFLKFPNNDPIELKKQILLGLQAMLVSPHFIYINQPPHSGKLVAKTNRHQPNISSKPLTEYELASRLSYFLWSSTPDAKLLKKAANNQLRATLTDEIDRMLNDPKMERFIENFSGQWLQLRDLEIQSPTSSIFPKWNPSLKKDALTETQLFLKNIIKKDLSALDCLDSDYTYLNQNLAKFYQIPNVTGNHFRKVKLTSAQQLQRGGILGHASILTLTSYPDRTSPVLRGKWILENLVGTDIPPPPQDIPALKTTKNKANKKQKTQHISLREQLEIHREKPECATCHKILDPLGFAMQNYDAIGKWRTTTKAGIINTKGKLISGENISNAHQLKNILRAKKSDPFIRCLTTKLLTYSLGRGTQYYDKPAIDKILQQSTKNNHSFRALIHSICHSIPFQNTRAQ